MDALAFCGAIEARGVDGLTSAEIAAALGYKNLRTNTFSAAVSSSRQFGLLAAEGDALVLTELTRGLLHPRDPAEVPRLLRAALLEPPLYRRLAARFGGKRVPDTAVLANVLQRQDQITSSAKLAAAEAFLASARFAGALTDDQILRPDGPPERSANRRRPTRGSSDSQSGRVRLELQLWGPDQGKVIRMRAPESMTAKSLERLIQAIRLHVRIDDPVDGEDTSGR